jgi:hypothetical protein
MDTAKIVQGEDRTLLFGVKDTYEEVYIDLTGVTAISVNLAAASIGAISFTMSASEVTVIDAPKGKFQVVMSDAKTATLKVGSQTMEVVIDWGSNAITVVKKIY